MNYNIELSSYAKESIETIVKYIAIRLCNKTAAKNTYEGIMKSINNLSAFPYKNKICDEELLKKINVRSTIYKNYKILYIIIEESKTIIIVNVFYKKRIINSIKI